TRPEPMAYSSIRQGPQDPDTYVLLRSPTDASTLAGSLRHALSALDPELPIYHVATLQARVTAALAGRRLGVVLMMSFGGLALLLASVGVYAMFAGMAAARERELSIRIALGASRRVVVLLVLRQGAVWMAVGLVVGSVGMGIAARSVRSLLFGVPPLDPAILGATLGLLVVCAAGALVGPLRRATRADPVETLH